MLKTKEKNKRKNIFVCRYIQKKKKEAITKRRKKAESDKETCVCVCVHEKIIYLKGLFQLKYTNVITSLSCPVR